jgi:hypothetical protein
LPLPRLRGTAEGGGHFQSPPDIGLVKMATAFCLRRVRSGAGALAGARVAFSLSEGCAVEGPGAETIFTKAISGAD